MNTLSVKELDLDKIPIIDIGSLRDNTDPDFVARKLYKASTDLGFIYIKNHNIPDKLINDLRNDGLTFFRSSFDEKEKVKISKKHRGWLGFGGAKMGDKAKPDLKESFIWGYQYDDGSLPDNHQLRGLNKWPDFRPSLQKNAMNYFNQINELAKSLSTLLPSAISPAKIFIPTKSLKINKEYKIYSVIGYDGTNVHRGFCPNCGSPVISYVSEQPNLRFIKAGSLDDSSWVKIESSFWSDSACNWDPVNHSLPNFPKNPT